MAENGVYLKMKTPADMMSANFLATSGQLGGRFVQEVEPPWTIWWEANNDKSWFSKIGGLIRGDVSAPDSVWETGVPRSALKNISWLDLFRKSVIKKHDTKKVASEVIVLTPDRELFFDLVKQHFVLQQGQIEVSVFEPGEKYYLLKINSPSLWVFRRVDPNRRWTWFNRVDGQSGLYVETGHYIHDISGDEVFNKFHILDNGLLIVQKDGQLLTLNPKWRKGDSLIKVECPPVNLPQSEENEKIEVKPVLRNTDERQLAVLWKIEDLNRLKAIIINESVNRFKLFKAWFSESGIVWIFAQDEAADRALATVLSDAFSGFAQIDEQVYVPIGRQLSPRLSSDRIHKVFNARTGDLVCLENSPEGVQASVLEKQYLRPVEDFIVLQAEKALDCYDHKALKWNFEFPELKKKKLIIEILVKTSELGEFKAKSEEGQIGGGSFKNRKVRKSSLNINLDDVPVYSENKISEFKMRLDQVDQQLMGDVSSANLWTERAEICKSIRMKNSYFASLVTAAILKKDLKLLADIAYEYCQSRNDFSGIFSPEVSELDKGKILGRIRNDQVSAEFNYLLLLAFAARFDDRDIFVQAVENMKTGYARESRTFYSFAETRVAGTSGMNLENRVELLKEDDFPRIRTNVNKFLQQLGCCPSLPALAIARKQFHTLLKFHLSEATADKLVSKMPLGGSFTGYYRQSDQEKNKIGVEYDCWNLIENWPESKNNPNMQDYEQRWLSLLGMEKISETPLKDFFTGELYKPPFGFYRHEKGVGSLSSIPWIADLSDSDFPVESDGKPIARAIYMRYADGHKDWDAYFKKSLADKSSIIGMARTQRLLLLMVSEFGPVQEFSRFILPATVKIEGDNKWDIYALTMYCDMYRLCLAYRKPVDEQRLFNLLISRTPNPPGGWENFRSSAEWIILCLLLTSSPVRRFQLDNLAQRTIQWVRQGVAKDDYQLTMEALTILSFLGIGVLADLVPEKLEYHQLLERRRVLWLEHAFTLSADKEKAWKSWQAACSFSN